MVPPDTSFPPFTCCKRSVMHITTKACSSSYAYCTFLDMSALLSSLCFLRYQKQQDHIPPHSLKAGKNNCCPAFWGQIRTPLSHISSLFLCISTSPSAPTPIFNTHEIVEIFFRITVLILCISQQLQKEATLSGFDISFSTEAQALSLRVAALG